MTAAADWIRDLAPAAKAEGASRPGSLRAFLEQDVVTDGGPWIAEGREPFLQIVETIDRAILAKKSGTEISVLAAEQVGKTLVGVGAALQLVADRGRNVGYFFPTKVFAARFGRTRLKRLIARSPYLASRMRERDAVNQMSLKEFDGHFFYLLGLESILDAISIPLDAVFYDEVDYLPTENQEWSEGRVAASDLRIAVYVSAGYIPGGGIDRRYHEGTQHRFLVSCRARGCMTPDICLEETFPECVARVRGTWRRVCPECNGDLDLAKNGRWVALHPEKEREGKISFRISSLVVPARDLAHVMRRWEKAKKKKSQLAKFRCAELAIPDAGAMQPVTDEALGRMQDKSLQFLLARGMRPRYAGMDTGDLCHFIAYERDAAGRMQLVWAEEIDSDRAEARATELLLQLGAVSFVCDKKPLTTVARGVAYRAGRIAALQDFAPGSELAVVEESHQGKTYRCVKVNRDESLDDLTSEITNELKPMRMPDIEKYEVLSVVAEHLKNLRKERTEDAKGRLVEKYVRGVANHFGMALNSARLAEEIAPRSTSWSPETHLTVGTPRLTRRSLGGVA